MARPGVNKLVLIIAAAAYIGWIWLSLPVPSPASKPVTVVSAYYEIPSKHSPAEYLQWTEHLVRIDCHLVLFCEGAMNCGRFRRLRPDDPTCLVIEWPLAQTDMASLESMWRDQITKDPEFHLHRSHWLYIVWAQKAWFVKKAEELDPFGSDLFLWMDAGAFRDPARLPLFEKGWPSLERALALTEQGSRVAGLAINPFPESPAPFLVGDLLGGHQFVGIQTVLGPVPRAVLARTGVAGAPGQVCGQGPDSVQ